MTSAMYDFELAVVVGRFQPFHNGHADLVRRALELAPKVCVVVASAHGPRLVRSPFSAEERIAMIQSSLDPALRARVSFTNVRDYYDEARWARALGAAVRSQAGSRGIALVGAGEDDSSAYLGLFPEWKQVTLPRQIAADATALRHLYFASGSALPAELCALVPLPVLEFLRTFRGTAEYVRLAAELAALERSRKTWGTGPFVTVDAVVTALGHVLCVQRGRAPGQGLWALPGGFLEGAERLLAGAIRELKEETLLALSEAELAAAFRGVSVFDHPARSQRGRTITHAHHFALSALELPAVKGADDAAAARWIPIAELPDMAEELFEDHFQILDHFLNIARD